MKTNAVLTRLIPAISAISGASVFNVVMASRATTFKEDLRRAANEDRYDVTGLIGALGNLESANERDMQQSAVHNVLELAEALLEQIAAGNPPHADHIPLKVEDLLGNIANDILSIQDVFNPKVSVLRRIRMNSSEVAMLVAAEAQQNIRPADHVNYANMIFEAADRLEDGGYRDRERSEQIITHNIKLLAA
jgi:hypothetical protein